MDGIRGWRVTKESGWEKRMEIGEGLRRIEGRILCRGTAESGRENDDGEELKRVKGRR